MSETEIPSESRPYHHGDLKMALLTEAEAILERDGIQALTLRAAARAAGVSHAAPANHFGDLTGLLSELAAVGFTRFSAALMMATQVPSGDLSTRSHAMGVAYVKFALAHPGLFLLMFRSERLDATRSSLHAAIEASRQALRSFASSSIPDRAPLPLQMAAQGTARWSLVHGFAMLLLDGRLNGMIGSLPDETDADDLLDAVLDVTRIGA